MFDAAYLSLPQLAGVFILAAIFVGMLVLMHCTNNYSLNGIKSKSVGNGQYGTARWATKSEVKKIYKHIPFEPEKWRNGEHLPQHQGTVVGCRTHGKRTSALVDTGDVHTLMVGAAGVGKTAFFLYPNLEFACASGMSFVSTDCKGDVFRNYGTIAKNHYGYHVSVLDLRNPTKSDENNILHLVNKYMDAYLANPADLTAKAKAEKYAKITAKTIINIGGGDGNYGVNAYFYDSAEGLLASLILLLAEFGDRNERHIVSVFRLMQDLLQPEDRLRELDTQRNDLVMMIASGTCSEDTLDTEFVKIFAEEQELNEQLQAFEIPTDTQEKIDSAMQDISREKFQLEVFDDIIIRKVLDCVKVLSKTELLVVFKGNAAVNVAMED